METRTTDKISNESIQCEVPPAISGWGKLAYAAMFLATLGLAATGIGTFAIGKAPMTHWILMAHASAAPLFAMGLAAVSLTWAGRASCCCTGQCAVGRSMFWVMLVVGLAVILSGVVPMTPVFGTHGQHALYLVHRYGGIVVFVAMAMHLMSLARARR